MWRRRRRSERDGAAKRARDLAERRLRDARRDWGQVEEVRDQLVVWIEEALGGRGGRRHS